MHIALGVSTNDFKIESFLNAATANTRTIPTAPQPSLYPAAELTFAANPGRRGGEWVIRDQFTHRHPAWSDEAGFPSTYDSNDRPYILVFRIRGTFHVRFSTKRELQSFTTDIPGPILNEPRGIAPTTAALLHRFDLESKSTAEIYFEEIEYLSPPSFDPNDMEDGRRRILTDICQRQGQQAFRRELIRAYNARCAITGEEAEWVLEAAHITPYMGPRTNAVSNGLLLRADIHTLFDLGLIAIHPEELKVKVSAKLAGTSYVKFHDQRFVMPSSASSRPSVATLRQHFSGFLP